MAKTKAASRKRQNVITRFTRETVGELRKVNWPTRQEATQLTTIVLVVIVFMSSLLGILDFVFSKVFGVILSLGG